MNEMLSYSICLFILILSIISSVKNTIKRRTISFSLERVIYYFSIFISILLISLKIDVTLKSITNIVLKISSLNGIYNDIFKIILLIILFFTIQGILYKLLKIILIPIFSNINRGSLFGILKSIIIISIIFIFIITYNNTIGSFNKVAVFNENKIYSELEEILQENTSKLTDEIVEEFLPASNIVIYYNGVTLEEGIKSTKEINEMAINLTENVDNDMDKAIFMDR